MPVKQRLIKGSRFHPRYWPTWLGLALMQAAARLPYPLLLLSGRAIGRLFALINPYRRTIVRVNLKLCFPELEEHGRRDLERRSFAALGASLLETTAGVWAADRKFVHLGEVEGLEHLQAAQDRGKGAILLSGHCCSLDFAGRILMREWPACFTYQEFRNPLFNAAITRRRRQNCDELINRLDIRAFVKALRANKVVWYAPDQDQGLKHSVFVPFFGIPASTLTATTRLAKMTGAAVLPFTIQRQTDSNGYRLAIGPALEDFPGEDEYSDARRFNEILEQQIRANPDQYLWIHRRFKTRPEGTDKLYPPKPSRIRRRKAKLRRQKLS